jgi:hypothetical protein
MGVGGEDVLCRFEINEARLLTRGHDDGTASSEFESELVGSIYFVQRRNGAVVALLHEDGALSWVVNLKRSFVASLQVNVEEASTTPSSATVTETDVTGHRCPMQYNYEHHPFTGRVSRLTKTKSHRGCEATARRGEERTGRDTTSQFQADVRLHDKHRVVHSASM